MRRRRGWARPRSAPLSGASPSPTSAARRRQRRNVPACERSATRRPTSARRLWRKEQELGAARKQASEELERAQRVLQHSMSRQQSEAISAVRRIVKQKKIRGLHGMLIELISCDDKFNTAVDVAAGNQLFQVVVDTGVCAVPRLAPYLALPCRPCVRPLLTPIEDEGCPCLPLSWQRDRDRSHPTGTPLTRLPAPCRRYGRADPHRAAEGERGPRHLHAAQPPSSGQLAASP